MAVDRVEARLRRAADALDRAGVRYAVVGGNAVAAWVARVDPGATRTTKDVDVLVRRADLNDVTRSLEAAGFQRQDLRRLVLFIDPKEPSRRAGVHLVWAGEKVRPSYLCPAPDVDEAMRDPQGFLLLHLAALVRMKLTSLRDIDRVHIRDMLEVGLIDDDVRASLPGELLKRLLHLERSAPDED